MIFLGVIAAYPFNFVLNVWIKWLCCSALLGEHLLKALAFNFLCFALTFSSLEVLCLSYCCLDYSLCQRMWFWMSFFSVLPKCDWSKHVVQERWFLATLCTWKTFNCCCWLRIPYRYSDQLEVLDSGVYSNSWPSLNLKEL